MSDDIREIIKKELLLQNKDQLDAKISIKCGKNKFKELIKEFVSGGINVDMELGTIINNSKPNVDNIKGFLFNKVWLSGYGFISFEHSLNLKDEEYIIEVKE